MNKSRICRIFISGRQSIRNQLLLIVLGIFLVPDLVFAAIVDPANILRLTNEMRINSGAGALKTNSQLAAAARNKAAAIFKEQNFNHNIGERKFSSWIKEAGYAYSHAGENLAMDFATSEGVLRAWLDSETHRENLLNPKYQEIGIAVAAGRLDGENTTVIVQIFGTAAAPAAGTGAALTMDQNDKNPYKKTAGEQPHNTVKTTVAIEPAGGLRPILPSASVNPEKTGAVERNEQFYLDNSFVLGDSYSLSSPANLVPAGSGYRNIALSALLSKDAAGFSRIYSSGRQPAKPANRLTCLAITLLLLAAGPVIAYCQLFRLNGKNKIG